MRMKPIIMSSMLVGLIVLVGVAHAGLHHGFIVMTHPGIECRENRMLNWTSSGHYSTEGQGYVLDNTTKPFIVICPVWNLEQMDIGDHRWTWGPSFGAESSISMDVIDNSVSQEIRCAVVFSDSMDWDGDGWADWSRSSEKETSGMGPQTLYWNLPDEGILSRDRFLTVECVLPPPGPHSYDNSRIAGYTYKTLRSAELAE